MTRVAPTLATEARRASLAHAIDDILVAAGWSRQLRHRARCGRVSLDRLIGAALEAGYSVAVTPEGTTVQWGGE